jgi:hypothetical protein
VKNQYVSGTLPGSWSFMLEDRQKNFDWMGGYHQSAGGGMLMIHVNVPPSPITTADARRANLELFVGARRKVIRDLSGGTSTQSGTGYSTVGDSVRARFGAIDPQSHKIILVEVRVTSSKVVTLEYVENSAGNDARQVDARGQAVLDGVALQ